MGAQAVKNCNEKALKNQAESLVSMHSEGYIDLGYMNTEGRSNASSVSSICVVVLLGIIGRTLALFASCLFLLNVLYIGSDCKDML
jgi:hypothetical protein